MDKQIPTDTATETNPSTRLRAAAAHLRDLDTKATPLGEGYAAGWMPGERDDGWAAMYGGPTCPESGYREGVIYQFSPDCDECTRVNAGDAALIATLRGVAGPLADWLERVAASIDTDHESGLPLDVLCALYANPIVIADAILGGRE